MIETQRGNSRPLGSTYSNQYTPRNDVYDPNHMNHHQNNDEQLNRNEFQQSNQSQYLKLEKSREEYNSNQYNFHNDNAHQSQANQPEQLNPQHHYSDYDNQHNTNFTHTHQQDGYHHIYPNSDPDNNNLYQNHHLNTTQSKQQTYNTIVTSTTTNLPSQYDYNIQLNSQLNNENVNQSMEDPLGRIKGHALAVFSQGKLITHFPKKQSRIENQTMVEKVVAGPITIRPVYESLYKDTRDSIEQNQGPLFGNKKTKKKKDVLGIIDLALSKDSLNQDQILYHQILRMIIEADGNKLKCVNGLLKLLDTIESDHSCMYQIQALLELGKMSEALEMCVTNKFWTMSVVLASHISKEVYSKTVSAFALNSFMLNGQTLRMNANQNQYPEMNFMFEYLGGAQSIDFSNKLITPHSWKIILRMIMMNKQSGDERVLEGLSDELMTQGRVIAANVCRILLSEGFCSGIDSLNSSVVLFGTDHKRNPKTFFKNAQAFEMTELYEYSCTMLDNAGVLNCLPHFLAYKVTYISYLIDLGYFEKAASYLDCVESFIKNYNEGSPYLHQKLLDTTKMLAERVLIKQNPRDKETVASNWMSRIGAFESFSFINALDRGINSLVTNAVGLDAEVMTQSSPSQSKSRQYSPLSNTLVEVKSSKMSYIASPGLRTKAFNKLDQPIDYSNLTGLNEYLVSNGSHTNVPNYSVPMQIRKNDQYYYLQQRLDEVRSDNNAFQGATQINGFNVPPSHQNGQNQFVNKKECLQNRRESNQSNVYLQPPYPNQDYANQYLNTHQNTIDTQINVFKLGYMDRKDDYNYQYTHIVDSKVVDHVLSHNSSSYEGSNIQDNHHIVNNSNIGNFGLDNHSTYHDDHSNSHAINQSNVDNHGLGINSIGGEIYSQNTNIANDSSIDDFGLGNKSSLKEEYKKGQISNQSREDDFGLGQNIKINGEFDTQDPINATIVHDDDEIRDKSQLFASLESNKKEKINDHGVSMTNDAKVEDFGFGNKKKIINDTTHKTKSEDPVVSVKTGWLGFFFKAKTPKDVPIKATKANMGNKSTFEFDPVLKKWVNKVGGMIVQEENVLAPPPMMPAYNYEPTTLRSRKYVDILNKTDNGSESSPFELPGFPKASYTIPGYSDLPSTKSNTPIGFQLPSMPSANFTVEPDIHNDQSLTKNYSQTNSQMFSVPNLNSATDRDGTFDTNTSNDHVHQFSQSPRAQTLSQFGNGIESNQPYDNSVYDANTISAQRNHHTEISHVMPHGQSIDNFMDAPQPYDPLLNTTQPFDPLMNTTQPYDPLLNPVFESCYQNDTQYPNSSLDNVNKNGTLSNNPDKIHLHSDNAETRASFNLANQLSKNVHESMNQCLSPNLSTQKLSYSPRQLFPALVNSQAKKFHIYESLAEAGGLRKKHSMLAIKDNSLGNLKQRECPE